MKSRKLHDTMVAAEKLFVAAYNRADAPALAAMYTADGQIMPPNAKVAFRRRALERLFRSFWKAGDVTIKLGVVQVQGFGDLAYEVGKYALFSRSGKTTDRGKYIVIWKRMNGQWKLYRDIFNSDLPAK